VSELRPIPDFPGYLASEDGRIWSTRNGGRWLVGSTSTCGYVLACLRINGRKVSKSAHRLVAFAWLGLPPFDGATVNHKNGIKTDNRVENLEWCSMSENLKHGWQTGLTRATNEHRESARRQGHRNRALSVDQVREIRHRIANGEQQKAVAAMLNVDAGSISRIARGISYTDVI
jgi:hypothetical protein